MELNIQIILFISAILICVFLYFKRGEELFESVVAAIFVLFISIIFLIIGLNKPNSIGSLSLSVYLVQ